MREKLGIPEAEWPRAIAELCGLKHIEEAAILSTCNRMEIYVVVLSQHRGVREVTEWMSKFDLKEVVAANKEDRLRKAMEAQSIITEESKQFEAWRDSLETAPTIKKLIAYAERIRMAELNVYQRWGMISRRNLNELSMILVKV